MIPERNGTSLQLPHPPMMNSKFTNITQKIYTTTSSAGYDNQVQEIVKHELVNFIVQYTHTTEYNNQPPVTFAPPDSINSYITTKDIK